MIVSISCRQAYRSIGKLDSLALIGQSYRWRRAIENPAGSSDRMICRPRERTTFAPGSRPGIEHAEVTMLYQIAVSVVLLMLAFTTLPRLQAEPEQLGARQEAIVPQQAPLLRSVDPDKPKVIDVRAIDPSLNEMAQ